VTTTDELFIVHGQDWVVGVDKFRVEDNLDTVRGLVEKLDLANVVEDRVTGVVSHVVSDDGRQRVTLQSKDTSLEVDDIVFGNDVFEIGHFTTGSRLKEAGTNGILNFSDGVTELFSDGLSLEGFDSVAVCRGLSDDESNDCDRRVVVFQAGIET
jgi:hypothetical protein